jgi:hypothetical protein
MSHSSTLQVRGESLISWVCPCGAKLYPPSARHAHEERHRRSKALREELEQRSRHESRLEEKAMSRRLTDRTARDRVQTGDNQGFAIGEDVTILQDVQTVSLKGSETVCESPLCDVSFPDSGLACKPKRFCSDDCAQQASLIRRTAALFGLTVERMVELLGSDQRSLSRHRDNDLKGKP